MFKFFFVSVILVLGMGFAVTASSPFDIEFPIQELDNCVNKTSCKAYCDQLTNTNACLEFSQKHGFVVKSKADDFLKKMPVVGPGNCQNYDECKTYCNDTNHITECINFAEKYSLVPKKEIESARNFIGKTGPGGCKGAIECRAYCDNSSHQEECLEFSFRKGLISKPQLEAARNMINMIEKDSPGGCKTENECRIYCDNLAHKTECVDFAEKNGFISKDDAILMRKIGLLKGPGGCSDQNECENYCQASEHQTECLDFAEKYSLMSKKELEFARKFVNKTGPGGCKGEACKQFCKDPQNMEICLNFAEENKLIPLKDIERARKFIKIYKNSGPGGCKGTECMKYCSQSENWDVCFNFVKKYELIDKEDLQELETGNKISKKIKESGGPGGCRTDKECALYCSYREHIEECIAFGSVHGGMSKEKVAEMLKYFIESETKRNIEDMDIISYNDGLKDIEKDVFKEYERFKKLEDGFKNMRIKKRTMPAIPNLDDEEYEEDDGEDEDEDEGEDDKVFNKCHRAGCSGEICTDSDLDVGSICIYRPEFACYKMAKCERQTSGKCSFTMTEEVKKCIKKSKASKTR